MRQNRGRRSGKSFSNWGNVIIFFVMAPIVAILITAGLFKYLILPYIVSDDNPSNIDQGIQNSEDNSHQNANMGNGNDEDANDTEANMTLRLEGMSLYNVQLGSFNNKENAQALVDKLKENEVNGYMVDKDGYKVFAGTFFAREEAERYRDYLKDTYNDAFLKEFYIGGTSLEYLASDQQYEDEITELIGVISDSYSSEASIWSLAIDSNNISALKEKTINNNTTIDTKITSIKGKIQSNNLIDLVSSLEAQNLQRKEMINGLIDNNPEYIMISYEKFNNILFDYMRTITQGQ